MPLSFPPGCCAGRALLCLTAYLKGHPYRTSSEAAHYGGGDGRNRFKCTNTVSPSALAVRLRESVRPGATFDWDRDVLRSPAE